jgi:hypothetical protein
LIYKAILKERVSYYNKICVDKKELYTEMKYYFDKTNFFDGVLFSLWRLNIKEIFQEIINKYNPSGLYRYEKLISGERHNSLSFYEAYNVKKDVFAEKLRKNDGVIQFLKRGN